MARPKPDKTALLVSLASQVLEHGLASASLRTIGSAIGTSDRMLIYHFGSKDQLMAELLGHIALELASLLERAIPKQRFSSEAELVSKVVDVMRSPPVRPYIRLWFDILSARPHGKTIPEGIAESILGGYLSWIASRHPKGDQGAPATLALIEGVMVLDAAGGKALADRAIMSLL